MELNLPEHILEDYFAANTLYKKDFKKGAIFYAILAVKETIQYFMHESIDFTQIGSESLSERLGEVLNDEELKNFETLIDIEKSIINFEYT